MVDPDYTVQLDRIFEGPMDLLLHLVREQEMEIHSIKITEVVDGYLQYLRQLENLNIEVAGEFLVMAATLMSIKSRSLLPREEVELDDELDPEDELIKRLLEYRHFKGAADDLGERHARRSNERPRGYKGEARDWEPEKTLDLGELTAFDILATFSRLMRETLADRPHQVRGDSRPLRWFVKTVGVTIRERGEIGLLELVNQCAGSSPRETLIGVFCALLELMKLGMVAAHQGEQANDIVLSRAQGADKEDLEDLIGHARFLDEEDHEGAAEEPPASAEYSSPPEDPQDSAGPTPQSTFKEPSPQQESHQGGASQE